MTLHNDIASALDQPRTLLELVDELGNRAGVQRLGSTVRDGDLTRRAKSMQRLGYTPHVVLDALRGMPGVSRRDGERAMVDSAHWRRTEPITPRLVPVTEWVLA